MNRVACVFALVILAGCTSEDNPPGREATSEGFEDLGVKATSTTGVLLGIVVDEAIRPVPDALVALQVADGSGKEATTDDLGRFAFGELAPGTYFLQVSHLLYTSAQASAEVRAGEEDPPLVKVQLARLFSQAPYTELTKFDGFLGCAYAIGVSSTCVNDYTRVTGERCIPMVGCYCAGGCFRDQNLSQQAGNIREYVAQVAPGWQSIIFEESWEPTSDAGQSLGFTVSYFARPNAGHWFGSVNGPNPLRLQLDVGVEHESASYAGDEPPIVPPNGTQELFVFFGAGSGSVVLNQKFVSFQTEFYYGLPPEGWSFIEGDPLPF